MKSGESFSTVYRCKTWTDQCWRQGNQFCLLSNVRLQKTWEIKTAKWLEKSQESFHLLELLGCFHPRLSQTHLNPAKFPSENLQGRLNLTFFFSNRPQWIEAKQFTCSFICINIIIVATEGLQKSTSCQSHWLQVFVTGTCGLDR